MADENADQIAFDKAFAMAIASSEQDQPSPLSALKDENIYLRTVVHELKSKVLHIQQLIQELQDCESTKLLVLRSLKTEKEYLLQQLFTGCNQALNLAGGAPVQQHADTGFPSAFGVSALQQVGSVERIQFDHSRSVTDLTGDQRTLAAASAEKRQQHRRQGGAGVTNPVQQQRQKQYLIGQIEAAYKAAKIDMPIGVPSCTIDALQRHLEFARTLQPRNYL
jgi:hypothetical protein